jgi:hypothetical protein
MIDVALFLVLTPLGISSVLSLKNLEKLDISGIIDITDDYFECLSKIGRVSKLTHLTCRRHGHITERTPIAFFKHCPDLQVYRLVSFSRFHILTYDF